MTYCRSTTPPHWEIRGGGRLTPAPFLIAGIVNVTPDSFSDGGLFTERSAARDRILQVINEGADIVDIGGESTRPGAKDIGAAEEWRRVAPAIEDALALRSERPCFFAVSVDTFRAETAAKALALGADIINDISGCVFEPALMDVLAEYKPGYVLGHCPARPEVMQVSPHYTDVVEELLAYFEERLSALTQAGLPESHISLDPCIGFGKTLEHTVRIVRALPRFAALGRPLYFGVSRKSFLAAATHTGSDAKPADRDMLTQAAVALLAAGGAHIHRVHTVAATRATLLLVDAFIKEDVSDTADSA